ncbi:MAG: flagellar hook-basal body complex protein [Proteobacteria bacterium]|nr:flagellar hook-basal body complex protein [Pseudomonadota bacterium]
MGYSLFQTSTLGMMSQAHALNTIGSNIANVNTGGYKRTDTRFATILSDTINNAAGTSTERSLGGVRPKDFATIDKQGLLKASERDLDLAIAGDGFFQVSPTLDVSGEVLYTRDGGFDISIAGAQVTAVGADGGTINVNQGYLTDKNGYFLLGVAPDVNGLFPAASGLTAMRVDQFAFTDQFTPTTASTLSVNLSANKAFGDPSDSVSLTVVDSNGKTRALTATFTKTPTANQWQMLLSGDNLTTASQTPGAAFSLTAGVGTGSLMTLDSATRTISIKSEQVPAAGKPGAFLGLQVNDTITLAGTTGNNGTFQIGAISADGSTITTKDTGTQLLGAENLIAATASSTRVVGDRIIFDANGLVTSPTSFTNALTWSDGATNSFTLDISKSTQFAGEFLPQSSSQNGLAASDLKKVTFDAAGQVNGLFADGSTRTIYKIPLAAFSNPNGMEALRGNVFAETADSGAARSVFADASGIAILAPSTLELSNVELSTQFTQMIQVQQAYNSSATVFKTVDEMTMVARDLKG